MPLLIIVIGVALAFDVTNGFHDSANAVAALVATKAARPATAILLAATFNLVPGERCAEGCAPLDGLVTQASSAGVILAAAALGGPVSTTHVVASSVVGVGAAQHRRHVRWPVVTDMALAWLITLPCAALLGALLLVPWRAVT